MNAPLTAREFVSLIFGRKDSPRLLVMLRAAFDASMDSPAGVTAVAGYIASVDKWDAVEEKWNNCLAINGLDRFRMTELFQERPYERALEIISDLSKVLESESKDLRHATAHMNDVDWGDLEKDSEYLHIYPHRQHACLDMCLDSISSAIRSLKTDVPVTVVFDNDYGNTEMAARVYEAWRERTGHPGFAAISFIKGSHEWESVPLQCADLLAGLIRRSPVSRNELDSLNFATPKNLDPFTRSLWSARWCGGHGVQWSLEIAKEAEELRKRIKREAE